MFLLLCVLVAVAPLVLQVAGQRWQVRAAAQQAESKSLISEVGSVIEHDYELARHWFMHQSQSRMLVYGAIAVCFAMFLALRQ